MTRLVRYVIVFSVLALALYVIRSQMGSSHEQAAPLSYDSAPVRQLSAEEQKERLEQHARQSWLSHIEGLQQAVMNESSAARFYRAAAGADSSSAVGQDPENIRAQARTAAEGQEALVSTRVQALAEAEALERRVRASNPRYWGIEIEEIRMAELEKRENRALEVRRARASQPPEPPVLSPTEDRYRRALEDAEKRNSRE